MTNENKQSLEEMFIELMESGLNHYEAEEHINNVIMYRYLDSVSPSEQVIRHSSYLDNKINSGMYDLDMEETYLKRYGHMFEEDEDEAAEAELVMREVNPETVGIPNYLDLVKEVKELRDFVNDIKIDKHLLGMIENSGGANPFTPDFMPDENEAIEEMEDDYETEDTEHKNEENGE